MKNFYTIKLLKLIKPDEWKDFEKFVASPYFNKGRNYLPLVKLLKKFYPKFDSEKLTKGYVYTKLIPDKDYKESVMKTMFSGLAALTEEFILQQQIKKSNLDKKLLLMWEYSIRGYKAGADKLYKELDKNSTNKSMSGEFHNRARIKDVFFDHLILHEGSDKEMALALYERAKNKIYDVLITIISIEKAWLLANLLENRDTLVGKIISTIDIGVLLNIIRDEDGDSYIPLRIEFLSLMCHKHPESESYYSELKKLVFDHRDKFDEESYKRVLLHLYNVCLFKKLSGKDEYVREIFELEKKFVEEDVYFRFGNDAYFDLIGFRNIVISGLDLNEIEWVEWFVSKYSSYLEPKSKKDMTNYCIALIFFAKKDFANALHYSNQVNLSWNPYKLDIKKLEAMVYYETSSTESLYSLLDTYSHLLRKSRFQNKIMERQLGFIKYLKSILKVKLKNLPVSELNHLKNNLISDNVSSKQWLLEKISELERK